jgi:DNA-binding Lrp family transcriptional regulator
MDATFPMDDLDRRIVLATQAGLPLVPRPYLVLAERQRLARLLEAGAIRRIGAVPNHYAIGYTANGMSVWQIDPAMIDAVGARVGGLQSVTHCYRRPDHPPAWPYNLFAMVHGKSRAEVEAEVGRIATLIQAEFPGALGARDILFSTRIQKKTGLRLGE